MLVPRPICVHYNRGGTFIPGSFGVSDTVGPAPKLRQGAHRRVAGVRSSAWCVELKDCTAAKGRNITESTTLPSGSGGYTDDSRNAFPFYRFETMTPHTGTLHQ
ncbi:hypothetical protein DPEC_G00149050 [Dallia pectoralis]|uniref:Uncharacterized protein n=1 Tax=Dallia pectoralis TaxID=75939 RepID=A0ACC2GIE6_DALPE|nr:hypothetical protein DPEC_G00149050 [Dallia pectoralis]